MKSSAILIKGGHVLTLEGEDGFKAQELDILLSGNRIAAIEPHISPENNAEVVIAHGRLVMPGLINAHLHSSEMFLRGRYEKMPLETWLVYSYPFFAEPVNLRLLYLRSMLVAIESLRSGVTMISDDFFDPPKHDLQRLSTVFQAYGESGIRANVASGLMNKPYLDTIAHARAVVPPEVQARLDFPVLSSGQYMAYCDEVLRHLHGTFNGRLRFMLAPSGPQRCTSDLMLACRDLGKAHGIPFHTHVLETRVQAVTGDELFGGSLVRYMDELGLLHPGVLMAHAVWVTDDDISRMGRAGVSVSYNAIANLKLGSGVAPVRRLLDAGVNVALGTDGASSNDTMRIFDVMRVAALVQSAIGEKTDAWLDANEVATAATKGGARAAMLGHDTGSLAVGKKADLIMLDLNRTTTFTPLSDAVRQLVYGENGSSVESVMVDGRFVIRNGSFTTINEAEILEEIRSLMPAFLRDYEKVEAENAWLEPYFREIHQRCSADQIDLCRYLPL